MSVGVNGRDIFGRNPEKRAELVELRTQGWSYPRLGQHFGCDHTTISYNLKRFAPQLLSRGITRSVRGRLPRVLPPSRPVPAPPAPVTKPPHKYARFLEEPINRGKKRYKDYRRESEARSKPKRDALRVRLEAEYRARVARRGRISWRASYNVKGQANDDYE